MPSSRAAAASPDLAQRLKWLTLIRTVGTTLLLVLVATRVLGDRRSADLSAVENVVVRLVVLGYVVTLVNGIVLRRGSVGPAAAWVQVALDVFLAGALVFLSGGLESPFAVMFSLAVIGAAFLLGRRGALASFALSGVAWGAIAWLRGDWVASVGFATATQLVGQGLIAALTSYIAEQLKVTGGRLSASEADLRSLQALQNSIVEAIPSGLLTCDAEGRISFLNHVAEQILAVEAATVIGRQLDDVLPGVRGSKRLGRRDETVIDTRHGPRVLGLTMTPLDSGTGGLLVVFQDLTELRRLESELRQIDHLAGLGRLSAQLAHEVRNPLASMRGAAQMLATDLEGSSPARLASLILREADRLGALVEEYLRVARPRTPVLRRQRLDAVVHDTLEMLRADPLLRTVRIEESLAETVGDVDAAQLKQVVINLVRNAADACKGKGLVRVTVASAGAGSRIAVWDSAGAVTDAVRPHLFEPFFTTKEGGTGLGLATSMTIIQAHGGTITIDSAPERGTSFVVELPGELARSAHG